MDNTASFPQAVSTPTGSPLRQLSSDQINQRIPQSPSLPDFNNENERPSLHRSRESISSEVQSKVAFLNSLSNPSSPTKNFRGFGHTPSNGALQRALLGFEESQASLASASAEIEKLREQVKSGQHRERMVSERIESMMEQLQNERESRNSDKKFYVAEVKKCRKQAYQAELNQVETQEGLKEAKQELRRAQAEVAAERAKKEEARQESFERAYAVSGLTEEIETLKSTLQAIEKERDAAILELRTRPVHVSAPIHIEEKAIQASLSPIKQQSTQVYDTDATPRLMKRSFAETQLRSAHENADMFDKIRPDHDCRTAPSTLTEPFWTDFVERDRMLKEYGDEVYTLEDHVQSLYQEVEGTRQIVERQREQIGFMKMECQAGCCACKRAEKRGERYIYDPEFEQIRDQRAAKKRKVEEDIQPKHHQELTTVPATDIPTQAITDTAATEPGAETPEVYEAAQVPLPSPNEQEFPSKEPSPEPTAVLEEMTQVMVEANKATTDFTFSTSTTVHVEHRPEEAMLVQTQDAIGSNEADLFDVSQPRSHPPRPSTAMGVLTIASPEHSPIRLVPDSPAPSTLPPRAATAFDDHATYSSHTTRVALKDSPARNHRRAQSRPNIRSQSQNRSPLVTSESTRQFDKSATASPAASTLFPVTPVLKHHRNHAHTQQTITTTTTVPLRDTEDFATPFEDIRSHTQPIYQHADADLHAESQPQLLKGVTGTPVSRDAALAQIRARRDRARSMNMKKMEAPGGSKTPGSARRGINLRDGAVGYERGDREVSIASVQTAPGRFGE